MRSNRPFNSCFMFHVRLAIAALICSRTQSYHHCMNPQQRYVIAHRFAGGDWYGESLAAGLSTAAATAFAASRLSSAHVDGIASAHGGSGLLQLKQEVSSHSLIDMLDGGCGW